MQGGKMSWIFAVPNLYREPLKDTAFLSPPPLSDCQAQRSAWNLQQARPTVRELSLESVA